MASRFTLVRVQLHYLNVDISKDTLRQLRELKFSYFTGSLSLASGVMIVDHLIQGDQSAVLLSTGRVAVTNGHLGNLNLKFWRGSPLRKVVSKFALMSDEAINELDKLALVAADTEEQQSDAHRLMQVIREYDLGLTQKQFDFLYPHLKYSRSWLRDRAEEADLKMPDDWNLAAKKPVAKAKDPKKPLTKTESPSKQVPAIKGKKIFAATASKDPL